jgi:hypothetical protein
MGNVNAMDVISDIGSSLTLGTIDLKKGRVNVPFSGAAMGDYLKGTGNLLTGEQMRGKVNDFFSTPFAKTMETVAGAVALTVVTFGVGSALAAPAVAGEVAAEGAALGTEAGGAAASAGAAAGEVAAGGVGATGLGAGAGVLAESAAPIAAAEAGQVAIPVSAGAMESATAADIAGASLTGPVGAVAAPEAASAAAPGGLASMVGAGEGAGVAGAPVAGLASAPNAAAMSTPEMAEIAGKSGTLAKAGAPGFWASLSPGAQMAMMTGGMALAQMGTGAMSGMFAGATAQQKLDLERLINSQAQAQLQYRNKNNQYAPLLTFKQPAGFANSGVTNVPPIV